MNINDKPIGAFDAFFSPFALKCLRAHGFQNIGHLRSASRFELEEATLNLDGFGPDEIYNFIESLDLSLPANNIRRSEPNPSDPMDGKFDGSIVTVDGVQIVGLPDPSP